MIALWKQWSAKIDAFSLRERSLVFAVAAGLVVLVVHVVALQPLLREKRTYLDRINLAQSQLNAINEELLKAAPGLPGPQVAKFERIKTLEQALGEAEKRLGQRREAEQLGPQQIPRLLRDILGANPSLRVQALRVVPPAALSQPSAPGGQASNAPKAPLGQFYRHGLEIEMTGTFLDLLKYLEDVEALPWRLAWAGVELRTLVYPQVQLRAMLYTVNASPTFFTF